MAAKLHGVDVFHVDAASSFGACAWKGHRTHSRSMGRLQRRGSLKGGLARSRGPCAAAENAQPSAIAQFKEKDILDGYAGYFVQSILKETVQDSVDDAGSDIEFIDDEHEGEATAELVAELVLPSREPRIVEGDVEPAWWEELPAKAPAALQDDSVSFDEEVLGLASDDESDDEIYDNAAKFYVEAAIRDAKLDETPQKAPAAFEEDVQELVIEADYPEEDFVLDYICELIDIGITGAASAASKQEATMLPEAIALSPCSRPLASAPSLLCPAAALPPVPAEALPSDCLPVSAAPPVAPEPAASSQETSSEVVSMMEKMAKKMSEEAQSARAAKASVPKPGVKRSRRRIIGGITRGPAAEQVPNEGDSWATASSSALRPLSRSATQSSCAWRVDLGSKLDESGSRSSSLARSYEALGGAQFFSMDAKEDGSHSGSRAGSRAGSPAWSFRPANTSGTSAMALDLGDVDTSASVLGRTQPGPRSSGLLRGQASPAGRLVMASSSSTTTKGSKPMGKSSSLGALTAAARGSKAGGLVLPALPGAGSRPASPASLSVAGWTVKQPRLAALGRAEGFSYVF